VLERFGKKEETYNSKIKHVL